MKIINNYQDINPGPLQRARIYLATHPLSAMYRKRNKKIPFVESESIQIIDQELTSDFISVDCAGWYFESNDRRNIAVETNPICKLQKPDANILKNYYDLRPDYLEDLPILCYHTPKFRYSTLEDFSNFFNVWGPGKYIVGVDSTKIKFNYLKYPLIEKLSPLVTWPHTVRISSNNRFDLIFIIEPV